MIVLTKSNAFLIKWIAELLGFIMNGIFSLLSTAGLPNVGLAIILFTIVIYALMTPLQVKQQRFSKMQSVMMPEIKKVQDKYKGKRDQVSMQKQNEEVQAVYEKYGVNAMGSCVQLAVQMPVLFALYQVIYRIPGYITLIKDQLSSVAETAGFAEFFANFVKGLDSASVTRNFGQGTTNNVIDTLYNLNPAQLSSLLSDQGAASFSDALTKAHTYVNRVTSFLGLNISDTPINIFRTAFGQKQWLLIFAAVLFPILAYLTQWFNLKLMPQANSKAEPGSVEASMKSMNTVMPIMSSVFCFTLPVGIGIYWIAGAVVRSVQQVIINRHLDKEDLADVIKKNQEKAAKKREKQGLPPQKITQEASRNVRNLEIDKKMSQNKNIDYGKTNYRAGSIASKADMVRQYNESHKK